MSSEFALFKETELKFSPVLLNVSEGFVYSLGGFLQRRGGLPCSFWAARRFVGEAAWFSLESWAKRS